MFYDIIEEDTFYTPNDAKTIGPFSLTEQQSLIWVFKTGFFSPPATFNPNGAEDEGLQAKNLPKWWRSLLHISYEETCLKL